MTRETVIAETPAWRATSMIVGEEGSCGAVFTGMGLDVTCRRFPWPRTGLADVPAHAATGKRFAYAVSARCASIDRGDHHARQRKSRSRAVPAPAADRPGCSIEAPTRTLW
jgi:hypothetical protein